MRFALLGLTILAALTTCKKNGLDINSFCQCNQSQNLDSVAISTKLPGSWSWDKQSCFSEKTRSADRNIKLTFKNDLTFSVNENSTILTQGTWNLMKVDGSSWAVVTSSPSEFLFGRILFCDNQLLFNASYIDGCDNLFVRIN